ncbi:MAG: NAD(P)H-binding protein [Williamsia sp.]|nr:NAD(P)H-binding protein [Williamsia sp.]
MEQQTAVVLGATGMIGNLITEQLLNDDSFRTVRLLVRRPVPITHPKLEVALVDFDNTNDVKTKLGTGDTIFSCMGTTQAAVKGNKALYRKIDHAIPVMVARLGKEAGFHSFMLVSSVGANTESSTFYIKLKGEVERDIANIGFATTGIFRPSMLLGKRTEKRTLERILQPVSKLWSALLFGSWSKFKSIEGSDVATAMITAAKERAPGVSLYEYNDMMRLAKK